MSATRQVSLLLVLAAGSILSAAVWASVPRSVAGPAGYSYTLAQADLGKTVYAARCAACHGGKMEGTQDGMDDAPPLIGARFDSHWRNRPQALYTKIKQSMPQDDPGALSKDQAADVVAMILRANRVTPSSVSPSQAQ
jgi:cytochrome c